MSNLLLALPFFIASEDVPSFSFARTLDRTWTDTPGSGGGNVEPDTFEYEGENWELWQVVPFLGSSVGPINIGDCRVQLRNRSINRGQMELEDMPSRVILSSVGDQTADWTNLPWEFNRPSANNKFSNVGSGNSARKGIDYEPVRDISGATPTSLGIAQGEIFTATLIF